MGNNLTKSHRPIVYRYYDYLKKNHLGEGNKIKARTLSAIMGVDLATQKYILKEINESQDFDKLVSTYGSIYMCKNKTECLKAINNEITVGLTRLNKGKAMAKKLASNGQYKLTDKDFVGEAIKVCEL